MLLVAACVAISGAVPGAASLKPVPIADRAKGADSVVVAQVEQVEAVFERNQWGDELIVSNVSLLVEEAIKGTPPGRVRLALEGGTVGDLTLQVSDLPELRPGDRAVFFLKRGADARSVPHLRGQGVLLLDQRNVVRKSSLTLDQVREMVRAAR
jgi:hypothetical protein